MMCDSNTSNNMSRLGSNMLLIVMVTICFAKSVQTQGDGKDQMGNSDKHSFESGEFQFALINKESENPQYGECWTNALTKVRKGCQKLTDDEQSRMAIALTNCHLEKAGFTTLYPCSEDQSLKSCLSPMQTDIAAFNAYTAFFTHSHDMCFFLESQVWHEKTKETVSKLAKSSEEVADQLEVILQNEKYFREALKLSADEMKSCISKQQLLFDKTFERMKKIQKLIQGDFSWIESFFYYIAACLLVYLATSVPSSAGVRLQLYMVVFLSWVAERTLFSWKDSENEETIYQNVWLVRTISSIVALLISVGSLCFYKDERQLNHKLLVEIHKKVHETAHEKDMSKQTLTTPHGEISVTVKGSKNNTSRSSSPSTFVGTMSATPSETEVMSERFTTTTDPVVCGCLSTCSIKMGQEACPCRVNEKACSSSCRCGTDSKPCINRSESDSSDSEDEEHNEIFAEGMPEQLEDTIEENI